MVIARLPTDFKDFLKLLNSNKARYLLVGGYAVGYHGYPRATANMDIWIDRSQENAQIVSDAVREFGLDQASESLFAEPGKIIRMGVPPFRIEILTTISGVDFDRCYESRVTDQIDGVTVQFISLNDLKINKKASARHKDLSDLENLP